MSDLEQRLRDLLAEDASRAPLVPAMPSDIRPKVRRRIVARATMTAAVIVSVVAGSVVAMERLAPSDSVPVEQPTEPTPTPEPTSGTMWPQSSLAEAREAQRLADAGDPRYSWRVRARLLSTIPARRSSSPGSSRRSSAGRSSI